MNSEDIDLAEIIWEYHKIDRPIIKSDLIIGLGSYDTRVADHCAKLWLDNWAPWIVFTGAEGNFTRGKWPKSEAEMFAEVAIAAGVDGERILTEPLATNTGDNIRLTKKLCETANLTIHSAILVAKPNMLRRGYATAEQWWPELRVTCDHPDTHFLRNPAEGHTPGDVANEIVGDLQRIIEYPKLGYQTEQPIPTEVMQAYEEIVSRGFTGHLL